MSKQALLGAILASSASLGLAVSGKCAGNDATAIKIGKLASSLHCTIKIRQKDWFYSIW